MKKRCAAIVLAFFCAGALSAVDPAEGYWLGVDDKSGEVLAGWEIYQDGGLLLGKMLSARGVVATESASRVKDSYPGFPVSGKVSAMPVLGTPWIFGLSPTKAGQWSGGSIIDPNDGKMYRCKIIYRPADGKKFTTDVLEMRGEIGLGIGRSQYWRRTSWEEAAGLR